MNIKPCPACESDDTDLSESMFTRKWSRFCRACGVGGPSADTEADADAAWNALPRRGDGLAWRSEPPDRPGWWWCDPVLKAATVARVVRVDYLDSYRSFPEARWAGPIPEPPAPNAEKEEPL